MKSSSVYTSLPVYSSKNSSLKFLGEIIQDNTPTERESRKLKIIINDVLTKLRAALQKHHLNAEVMLGGSAAKGTFLKNEFDCDIFIRFAITYNDENLSDLVQHLLPFKAVRVHGSRDYFKFIYKKINVEFIPVLKVSSSNQAQNVMDMSPLHVAWVKKHLTENLRFDILLTKLFCKAQGVYGAESYINGFSGHVVDILTIYYGGFMPLLKAAALWKSSVVIDPMHHHTANQLNASKKSSLIVIDPLQPERNAAAALSLEKFTMFVTAAQHFMKKPSKKFFEIKPFSLSEVKKKAKGNELLLLKVVPQKNANTDIQGTKILKVFEFLNKHCALHEFKIIYSNWHWDKKSAAYLWFYIKKGVLSSTKLHRGPPLHEKKAGEHFKEKHAKTFVKEQRLYCSVKRTYRRAQELVKMLLKDPQVKERVKNVKLL